MLLKPCFPVTLTGAEEQGFLFSGTEEEIMYGEAFEVRSNYWQQEKRPSGNGASIKVNCLGLGKSGQVSTAYQVGTVNNMLASVRYSAIHCRCGGVTMSPKLTITIKDRNCTAFLLARGFTCTFVGRADGSTIDAEFKWSESLDQARQDYIGNRSVPVQSFVAASRHIGEQIRRHNQNVRRI